MRWVPLNRTLPLVGSGDVVFTNGTWMSRAAKQLAKQFPKQRFVYACVTDPVGLGLIDAVNQAPSGNFTGIGYSVPVAQRQDFVLQSLPDLRAIGFVYADTPRSRRYQQRLEQVISSDPRFSRLKIHSRKVLVIKGEGGSRRMAQLAEPLIRELDPSVDVFLSPIDQLGVSWQFADTVYRTATKPLIGLGRRDVLEGWGAAASIYPSLESVGRQAASMIVRLMEGAAVKQAFPEWPDENQNAFDLHKARRFNLKISAQMLVNADDDVVL